MPRILIKRIGWLPVAVLLAYAGRPDLHGIRWQHIRQLFPIPGAALLARKLWRA